MWPYWSTMWKVWAPCFVALRIHPVASEPCGGAWPLTEAPRGTRSRTSCHSEPLSQLGRWYSCKEASWAGGVTSENRKKSISDPGQKCPDQLRLHVTCVCLWGRERAEMSRVVPKKSWQWNVDTMKADRWFWLEITQKRTFSKTFFFLTAAQSLLWLHFLNLHLWLNTTSWTIPHFLKISKKKNKLLGCLMSTQ